MRNRQWNKQAVGEREEQEARKSVNSVREIAREHTGPVSLFTRLSCFVPLYHPGVCYFNISETKRKPKVSRSGRRDPSLSKFQKCCSLWVQMQPQCIRCVPPPPSKPIVHP